MDPAETGERFWYSPESSQMKSGLVTRYPGRSLVLIYLTQSYTSFGAKEMEKVDLRSVNCGQAQVDHYLPTPDHLIERYGERVTDRFGT